MEVAVCGIKCVNLKVNTMKIPGIRFSYNNKLNTEKNFLTAITNIQNVLKIWRISKLTLEGKVIVFKTLALSNTVQSCLTSVVPKQTIKEIENIQKNFL